MGAKTSFGPNLLRPKTQTNKAYATDDPDLTQTIPDIDPHRTCTNITDITVYLIDCWAAP